VGVGLSVGLPAGRQVWVWGIELFRVFQIGAVHGKEHL
jgi:hypothetical protein